MRNGLILYKYRMASVSCSVNGVVYKISKLENPTLYDSIVEHHRRNQANPSPDEYRPIRSVKTRVVDITGHESSFMLKPTEPILPQITEKYPPDRYQFIWDGIRISSTDTAASIGMSAGDFINVIQRR